MLKVSISRLLSDIVAVQRNHPAVAAVIWLASCLAAALVTFPRDLTDLPILAVVTTIMATFACHTLARYQNVLKARISAHDGGVKWQVAVNGITVGEMSDADYAGIQHSVFFDARVYGAQLLNFANVGWWLTNHLFTGIPMVAFWFAVSCFVFAPDTFASAMAALQQLPPVQVVVASPTLINLFFVTAIMTIGVRIAMGSYFGFIDRFDQACNDRIRHALNCPAYGEISLFHFGNGIATDHPTPASPQ